MEATFITASLQVSYDYGTWNTILKATPGCIDERLSICKWKTGCRTAERRHLALQWLGHLTHFSPTTQILSWLTLVFIYYMGVDCLSPPWPTLQFKALTSDGVISVQGPLSRLLFVSCRSIAARWWESLSYSRQLSVLCPGKYALLSLSINGNISSRQFLTITASELQ